jgi:hypothetical protein
VSRHEQLARRSLGGGPFFIQVRLMAKIPSRKFPTTKKKIASRKFPKSQRKIPSRKFARAPATEKHVAQVLLDRPTDEESRLYGDDYFSGLTTIRIPGG